MPRASGVQTGKGSRYRIAVVSGVALPYGKTAGVKIDSYKTLKEVLKERIRYFDSVGCLACDHSFHIYHMKNAARMSSKRYSERVRQAKNRLNLSATATKPTF